MVSAALLVALAMVVVPAPPPPPGSGVPGPTAGLQAPDSCAPPEGAGSPGPVVDVAAAGLRLDTVHRLATGAGQRIAVIDTGVSPHPRLAGRLTGIGDYLQGGDGLDDCDGHGTAVAGLLAAAPDDADGFTGIAPAARVLSIRQSSTVLTVRGPDGAAQPGGDTDTLADAVVLAVRRDATVVNISGAVCLPPARAASAGARLRAALRYAADSDVVVVAAAGNIGTGGCGAAGLVSLPGWLGDDLLTVAAVEPGGSPSEISLHGPWVDVAAPGTRLRSLAAGGGFTGADLRGTSFAVPWVAGTAALVRQRFPRLSARQVADRIIATARRSAAGLNEAVGHGVVDPLAALTAEPLVPTGADRPAEPPARPTAALPGAGGNPPTDTDPASPAVLVAAILLGGAAIITARLGGWRMSPRRPPAPRPPGPAPAPSGAAAAPPRGPVQRR